MKFTTLASLAMATLALGQSLADLPTCATSCLSDAVKQSTTCAVTDLACICKKFGAIQGAAAGCILSACGKDVAINQVLPVTQKLCAKAGEGSSSAAAGPQISPPVPTGTVVPVVPKPITTQRSPPATTASTEPASTASSYPAASTSASATGGASAIVPMGGLAMLVLGMMAL